MIRIEGQRTGALKSPVPPRWISLDAVGRQAAALIRARVHERGQTADGAPIAVGSDGLPKRFVWTGAFRDSLEYQVEGERVWVTYGLGQRAAGGITHAQLSGILFAPARRSPMALSQRESALIGKTVADGFRETMLGESRGPGRARRLLTPGVVIR